jgi:hypothetical protein
VTSIAEAAGSIANGALRLVQDPARGVRVEDFLTLLAAGAGEAALVASGVVDIESTDLAPGSFVIGDPINIVLTGDEVDLDVIPPACVVGILAGELVPSVVPLELMLPLERWYQHTAQNMNKGEWGSVVTSVPADHQPTVLPLRVAYELRPVVEQAMTTLALPRGRRHEPCVVALAHGITQVRDAIDLTIAVTLAFEVLFAMAKMVPMSKRTLDDPSHR